MKKVKSLLLFTLVVASLNGFAQTADEVVDKHLAAIGGKDAWKKVTTVITEGNMDVQGASVNVVSKTIKDKGTRQDISVMGMSGFTILTPSAGWVYMPWAGQGAAEAIPDSLVKQGADQLDTQGSLVDYAAKGNKIELAGKEDVDGKPTFKIKVLHKSGKAETLFIDASTYYIVKSVTVQQVNGQSVEGTTWFSDYKKQAEGYVVPMKINMPISMGMNVDLNVTKVAINQPIEDSIFKP